MRRFSKTKVASEPRAKAGLLPASALRNVPNEVLQRAFFFAVVNQVGSCNRPQLLAICSVSRRWYNSAIKHCPLWTTLPPIHLDDKADLRSTRRIVNGTTVYLARSGILPISFQLTIEDGPEDDSSVYRKTVSTVTSLIVSQCHRWAQASLKLSAISILDLMPMKGRLPLLTNLKLSYSSFRTLLAHPDTRVALFDLFQDASQLRHLAIATPSSFHDMFGGMSGTSPAFGFQWTQLENI
ncbi:hypothetical protein FA13DRAFT_312971 [Coprinellus micaceus]|uniref:F-box domain-containing protein n=1 Tax=Coprinellus micaceus TaxID=71717 RepID=A0A4Y7TD40_COPMI|nr:hypothetical protein FA13DRAFT_312971 [Coprinellus micaceus]